MRSLTIVAVFAVTVWMSLPAASQAALVASESFATSAGDNDYVPLSSILGQNPTVGSTGFTDAWGVCCTTTMVPITGGLTHELLPGETFDGQLVSNTTSGFSGGWSARNLSRAIDYTPTDGTYYMSVLLSKNAATNRGDLLAGLGRSQNGDTGVLNIDGTWIGFLDGGISFLWGTGAHIAQLRSASQVHVGETYVALLQYDFSTTGPDTVVATVFNGWSEKVASSAFTGLDLDDSMGRFSLVTQDWESIPRLDEWRFGTELSDVLVAELMRLRSFGSWAREHGYSPGAVMPAVVDAQNSDIEDLSDIGDYDWTSTPTTDLLLVHNQISNIEAGSFNALTNLTWLDLGFNKLSSIEAGDFSGLTNLLELSLWGNGTSSIEADAFSELTSLTRLSLGGNQLASIEAGSFNGLMNLTELDLTGNPISSIAPNAFSGLTSLPVLDLNGTQLTTIVADAFSGLTSLTELDLAYNQISSIEPGAFSGLASLTLLSLGGNQLASVEAGTFNGLMNLTELDLTGNPISSIAPNAFSGLTSLPILRLNGTQLTTIVADTFSGLTSLADLDLASNQITSIEAGAFSELPNLTTLNLYGNQISSLEVVDFSGLGDLTVLGLGINQISSIASGTFGELPNLTTLYLYGNQISSIEAGAFSELPNLTYLSLSINQISSIDTGDFSGLAYLTALDLYGNQITSIEPGDFSGLANLVSLDLGGNQISSLETGDFSGLTNLTSLYLGGNQVSTIEPGALSGLTSLTTLYLSYNPTLTDLNLAEADFSNLTLLDVAGNENVTRVSLDSTVLTQESLVALVNGAADPMYADYVTGIGEIPGVTELDLSGVDFAAITDLTPLYSMDDLTDLWLVNTANLDAVALDVLLDNLATIQGTAVEGILHMTQADYEAFNLAGGDLLAAWNVEAGHHVEFVLPGDFNSDGIVDAADYTVWRDGLGSVYTQADYDVWKSSFGDTAGSGAVRSASEGNSAVPEPASTLLLLVGLAAICLRPRLAAA